MPLIGLSSDRLLIKVYPFLKVLNTQNTFLPVNIADTNSALMPTHTGQILIFQDVYAEIKLKPDIQDRRLNYIGLSRNFIDFTGSQIERIIADQDQWIPFLSTQIWVWGEGNFNFTSLNSFVEIRAKYKDFICEKSNPFQYYFEKSAFLTCLGYFRQGDIYPQNLVGSLNFDPPNENEISIGLFLIDPALLARLIASLPLNLVGLWQSVLSEQSLGVSDDIIENALFEEIWRIESNIGCPPPTIEIDTDPCPEGSCKCPCSDDCYTVDIPTNKVNFLN